VDETCTSLPFGNEAGNPVGASCAPTPNSLGTAGDATEHHFTGKVRDSETGNDYFLARYYSSALGRFTTPDWSAKTDPVPYAVFTDPQSLNLYAYVRNNPLTRVDADGHCWGGGWCDIHSNPYQTDSEKNAAKKQAQQQSKEVNTVYNETSGLRPDTASDPNSAQNLQTARQNVAHVYENTNGNGFQSSDQLSGREKSAIKNGDPTATASMASSQQAVAAAHQDRTDPTHGATHIYLYDLSPNSTQRVPAWVRNGNPTTVQGPFINAAGGGDVRAGSLVLILTIKDQR